MEPFCFDGAMWSAKDVCGNVRWHGKVNGKNISRARLVMQNFLHTAKLPHWLYVHHGEAGTECDEIWNLLPTTNSLHGKIHHPTEFTSRYECEKHRRLNPEVQQSIRNNSLKWYHKNKDVVNSNPEIQEYKKNWYIKNKESILKKLADRYQEDVEYRNYCIVKSKIWKENRNAARQL